MAANGISTLSTKQQKQVAKLNLAQTKRQGSGNGNRILNVYDITLLPTQYSGNSSVDNPGSLVQGRPWT
jgi:hypothetical protein